MEMKRTKPHSGVLAGSFAITVVLSALVAMILSLNLYRGWWLTFAVTLIGYPFVSYGAAHLIHFLCSAVDRVFELEQEPIARDWDSNTMLLVGSVWPIAIWFVPILIVAILIGALYRGMWSNP